MRKNHHLKDTRFGLAEVRKHWTKRERSYAFSGIIWGLILAFPAGYHWNKPKLNAYVIIATTTPTETVTPTFTPVPTRQIGQGINREFNPFLYELHWVDHSVGFYGMWQKKYYDASWQIKSIKECLGKQLEDMEFNNHLNTFSYKDSVANYYKFIGQYQERMEYVTIIMNVHVDKIWHGWARISMSYGDQDQVDTLAGEINVYAGSHTLNGNPMNIYMQLIYGDVEPSRWIVRDLSQWTYTDYFTKEANIPLELHETYPPWEEYNQQRIELEEALVLQNGKRY